MAVIKNQKTGMWEVGLITRTGPVHEGKRPRGASLRRAKPRNGNVLLS